MKMLSVGIHSEKGLNYEHKRNRLFFPNDQYPHRLNHFPYDKKKILETAQQKRYNKPLRSLGWLCAQHLHTSIPVQEFVGIFVLRPILSSLIDEGGFVIIFPQLCLYSIFKNIFLQVWPGPYHTHRVTVTLEGIIL